MAADYIEGCHDNLLVAQVNPQIITLVGKPYGHKISYLMSTEGPCAGQE